MRIGMQDARARRARAGFTLIEVVVAITILASAMLGIGAFIATFSKGVNLAQTRASAVQLATERLENARNARRYADLDSMARTENPPAGTVGWQRVTAVTRVGGATTDSVDYKIVTVTVTGRGLPAAVKKTAIVANF